MTVKELIEALSKFDENTEVYVFDDFGYAGKVKALNTKAIDGAILLEDEIWD